MRNASLKRASVSAAPAAVTIQKGQAWGVASPLPEGAPDAGVRMFTYP